MKLSEKWQKVLEQKGGYIVQKSSWWKWKKKKSVFYLKTEKKTLFGQPSA